jgi:chorismate mutase
MGDAQRAAVGKRHRTSTPLRGVPSDFADEPTPAPVPVDFDETMDLNAQVSALQAAVNKQVRASNRDWGFRDAADRLDRIESNLGTLAASATRSETILSEHSKSLDHWRAATDAVARDLPRMLVAIEGLTLTVQNVDHRLRDLEVRMQTSAAVAEAKHAAADLRMADAETVVARHEIRLKEIEDNQLVADATKRALAKTSRKSGGASGGIVAAIVSIGAAIASHLAK